MIDINNVLVLMIDIQEKLVKATKADEEANNASKIIHASNILDIPVIVTEQYPKGLGQTLEEIKRNYGDNVQTFEKQSFSALDEDEIIKAVSASPRKQIVLFGIELHICVLQTALDLLLKGYEVFIVKNASKSRDNEDFNIALDILKQKGASVISLEILLFELLESSKHPNFKEIQALIK